MSPSQEGPEGEFRSSDDVRTAFISGNNFRAQVVRYVDIDGDAIFEGDIVLGPVDQVERESEQLKAELRGELESGVIITGDQFRWPGCLVPYDIDPALTDQARVTEAIAHWQQNTNFRFEERTAANAASHPNWVTFRPGSGCSSSVGMRGGQQFINLAGGCDRGRTIHEIGHAVGLWHEQSRADRDAFVTINWANIQAGFEHNFNQHITDGDDVGAYDYGSIMHYPRDAFGVGGAETITPVDPAAQIGQRVALSAGDIAAANVLCPGKSPAETLKELGPETLKERLPETLKELQPETVKELAPETLKERLPETLKELQPETVKERIPETVKERIETIRENLGGFTLQEGTLPGTGGRVVDPGQFAGRVPFALGTPHAGAPGTAGTADAGSPDVLARLAALEAAVDALAAEQAALVDQVVRLVDPGQ
ncbi:M12 family metallopeptidase [Cellulomonas sp. PS-H5]|uniref:M12 family metallopeptidase n=1 Tax=Cellulomonas sp. PS-H5 TaxID=2820400 RepID=UPI001C4F7FBD|nr:M12 family metallopeptidase [Cellulomonas sp. PS-H5]MBW0254933.1 M12 family metallopeptidase [Cellulomonas sp. PS-H5]